LMSIPAKVKYWMVLIARRFTVTHPRWEPDARIELVRICAGGVQQ
jgi:hypothetical protein